MAAPRLPYVWNAKAFAYVDPVTKRFVSGADVRAATDRALAGSSRTMADLAVQLREKRISLAQFEFRMMEEIRSSQLFAAAMAKGGFSQLTPADYGRAGREIRRQYDFLKARVAKIESGAQSTGGKLEAIAAMYGDAGRRTYFDTERREMALRGYTHERRVRGRTDSCPPCVSAAAKMRQPIGTLPSIGSDYDDKGRCKCHFVYYTAEQMLDAA